MAKCHRSSKIINAEEVRGKVRASSVEEVRLEFSHWRMGRLWIKGKEVRKGTKVNLYGWLPTK